jgi:hypothetical protein
MDCDVPQAKAAAPQEDRGRRKRNAAEPAAAAGDAADNATARKKAGRAKSAAAAAGDAADVTAEPDAGAAAGTAEVKQLPDEQVGNAVTAS